MSADDDEASQVPEWFEKLPPEMQAMYVRLGLAPDDWYPGGADAAAQMDPISGTYNRMAQDLWIWSAIPGGTLPYYGVAAAYQLERPGDYTRYLSQTESSEAYYAARGEPYGIGRQGEPVGYLVEESRAGYYQTEAALAPWKAVYDLAKLASYVAPGAGMARAGLLAPYTFGLDIMAGQAEAPYLRTIGQMFGPTAEMDVIRSSQIFYGYQFPQMADVGTGVLEWAGGWALMRAAGSPVAALSALESGNFGYFQGGAGLSLPAQTMQPFGAFAQPYGAEGISEAFQDLPETTQAQIFQGAADAGQSVNEFLASNPDYAVPVERDLSDLSPLTGWAGVAQTLATSFGQGLVIQGALTGAQTAAAVINYTMAGLGPQLYTDPTLRQQQVSGWTATAAQILSGEFIQNVSANLPFGLVPALAAGAYSVAMTVPVLGEAILMTYGAAGEAYYAQTHMAPAAAAGLPMPPQAQIAYARSGLAGLSDFSTSTDYTAGAQPSYTSTRAYQAAQLGIWPAPGVTSYELTGGREYLTWTDYAAGQEAVWPAVNPGQYAYRQWGPYYDYTSEAAGWGVWPAVQPQGYSPGYAAAVMGIWPAYISPYTIAETQENIQASLGVWPAYPGAYVSAGALPSTYRESARYYGMGPFVAVGREAVELAPQGAGEGYTQTPTGFMEGMKKYEYIYSLTEDILMMQREAAPFAGTPQGATYQAEIAGLQSELTGLQRELASRQAWAAYDLAVTLPGGASAPKPGSIASTSAKNSYYWTDIAHPESSPYYASDYAAYQVYLKKYGVDASSLSFPEFETVKLYKSVEDTTKPGYHWVQQRTPTYGTGPWQYTVVGWTTTWVEQPDTYERSYRGEEAKAKPPPEYKKLDYGRAYGDLLFIKYGLPA